MNSKRILKSSIYGRLPLVLFFILLFLLMNSSNAMAEGSKELNSEVDDAFRAFTEWDNGTKNAGVERTTLLKVIMKKGERACLGSSVYNAADTVNNRSDNDILVRCQTNGQEYYFDVKQTGEGYIKNRKMELAGPDYNGTVADGYEPIYFEAPFTGVYEVEFHAVANTAKNIKESGVTNPDPKKLKDPWNKQGASVAAWDITVLNYNGEPVKGRVFTNYIALNTGTDAVGMYSNLHILTTEGYQYSLQTNGIGPYGFILYANNVGLINGPTGLSLCKNALLTKSGNEYVPVGGVIVPTPDWANKIGVLTHRLFFNDPDDEIAEIASDFPVTPREMAKITKFEFVGNRTDGDKNSTTEVSAGGVFNATFTDRCTYDIIIDSNKDGAFKASDDVILSAAAASGSNSILWDGKDNDGNPLLRGDYNVQIRVHGGEFHFPMIDAERCPNGIKINLVNAPEWLKNQGHDTTTVYYDSRDYSTYNGTNIKLKGAGTPDPIHAVEGISSRDGAIKFGTTTGSGDQQYGNDKVMDVWSYITDDRAGMDRVKTLSMKIEDRDPSDKMHGAIMGTVYFDGNKNKIKESSEKTMENVNLKLYIRKSGIDTEVLNGTTPVTATTNGRGQFVFNNIPYNETGEQYVVKPDKRVENVTHTQTTNDTPVTLKSSNVYTDNIGLYTEHDVKVEISADKSEIESGKDSITFTVKVTNTNTTYPANNSKVKMPTPAVNGEPAAEEPYQGTYSNGLWNIGKIPESSSVILKLKMNPITTTPDTVENITFKATASCDDDNNPANNVASVSFKINPSRDFSVEYDKNDGFGDMAAQNGRMDINDGKITLSKNQFTRPGYEFLGWTTDKDIPVVKYEDEAEYTGTGGKILKLYALWNKLPEPPGVSGGSTEIISPADENQEPQDSEDSQNSDDPDGTEDSHDSGEGDLSQFKVVYVWKGGFPAGLEVPMDISKYNTRNEVLAALDKIYSPGMKIKGNKDGQEGFWIFDGWDVPMVGWNDVMNIRGSWSFEANPFNKDVVATEDNHRMTEYFVLMIFSLIVAVTLLRRREE